jgi:hypothetical protein
MSILHVRHIKTAVEKRFRGLIDLSDLSNSNWPEAHREDCFLTRGLAAFVIAELSGVADQIAATSVVDEFRDNGIDALYYDAPEQVCYLVQSK